MSDESSGGRRDEHLPEVAGPVELTPAQVRHEEMVAGVAEHMRRAREQLQVLVTRTRVLVRNGVDLRDPERALDHIQDQVMDAVNASTVHECSCSGAQGAATLALLAEVTRELAVLMEGRDR